MHYLCLIYVLRSCNYSSKVPPHVKTGKLTHSQTDQWTEVASDLSVAAPWQYCLKWCNTVQKEGGWIHRFGSCHMKQWITCVVQTLSLQINPMGRHPCADCVHPGVKSPEGSVALSPPSPVTPLPSFSHCPRCPSAPHAIEHPGSLTCAVAAATHEQLRSPRELNPLDNLCDLCCAFFACRLGKLWLLSTFFFSFWSCFATQLPILSAWNQRKQLKMKFENGMIERQMDKYIFTDSPTGFSCCIRLHTWLPLLKSCT